MEGKKQKPETCALKTQYDSSKLQNNVFATKYTFEIQRLAWV